MTPTALRQFAGLYPAIKADWISLLRGEPTLTPLGRPDTLVFLMDATLGQLLACLSREHAEDWIQHCPALIAPVHGYCACGLNPLLKYFTTGEVALRAAAGATMGADIEEIVERLRALAQHEVDSLCSLCRHPQWTGCELRRKPTAD